AAMLGAEEYGFCTAALIVMGCVMLRHCHLNNCSVGVATQDVLLEKRFAGKVDQVVNYFHFVAEELRETMALLGIRTMNELIGRTDLLEVHKEIIPWKAPGIDYSRILFKPDVPATVGVYCRKAQDHGIDHVLDRTLIEKAGAALGGREPVRFETAISNVDRAAGAMLSGEVAARYGEEGLNDETISVKFKGIAGQSFGAWLAKGITFELEGMANDYIGKGLSGGKIIVYPDKKATYRAEDNIIIGNTTFYGAIAGEAYIRGRAGERFCIRNSGLYGVVEGVGDHGCEYMTGGRVLVLGRIGRNFAAGMSGGIAYVYDPRNGIKYKCNREMVELEGLVSGDVNLIKALLQNHVKYTQSRAAKDFLGRFDREIKKVVKVMPIEYKRILLTGGISRRSAALEVLDG
ncbi:MAG: glutamate synthase-related protein, partial [Candidatus Omnitrophica bacterium]|nr:glutamate synthase-related protein [Candidatus Omnitrophota bacterium]